MKEYTVDLAFYLFALIGVVIGAVGLAYGSVFSFLSENYVYSLVCLGGTIVAAKAAFSILYLILNIKNRNSNIGG
jgi:hypothetical protein